MVWDPSRNTFKPPTGPTPPPIVEHYPAPAPAPVPGPTVPLPPAPSPIAPEDFAALLYGQSIPVIIGGTVEVGGKIIEGPVFGIIDNESVVSFIAGYYIPVNYWDATRAVTKLWFHGKEAWNSTDGVLLSGLNVGGATVGTEQRVRFMLGVQPDAWSVGRYGASAVSYSPMVRAVFENIRTAQFDNQIPFTSITVEDTAFGDPSDLVAWADILPAINRYDSINTIGAATRPFDAIDVSEGEYAVILGSKIVFPELLAGLRKLKPHWSILTKDALYVVEKGSFSLDLTLEQSKLIKRGPDPITIHHADVLNNARELLVNFIDIDRDYEPSTAQVSWDLEPVSMTGSFDSESINFPGVSSASRMLGQANFALSTAEVAREKAEFSGQTYYLGMDPGDTFLIPLPEQNYFHRIYEIVRKPNHMVEVKSEGMLTCADATTPTEINYNNLYQSVLTGATQTFTGVAIGAAAADRVVVVIIGGTTNNRTITGVTIDYGLGPVTMPIRDSITGSGAGGALHDLALGIVSLAVPTGTTATIEVTWSGAIDATFIAVYSPNLTSAVPSDTATLANAGTNPSVTLDVPTNGTVIAGYIGGTTGYTGNPADLNEVTWTGLGMVQFDQDLSTSGGVWHGSAAGYASLAAQTGRTISVTKSSASGRNLLIAASFG